MNSKVMSSMEPKDLIKKYLTEGKLMQVASVKDGKPWICSVYYVVDDKQNLYWLSLPTRRHSQEIAADNHVAVAVAIKHDQPVIGIQAEGMAAVVSEPEVIKQIMQQYTKRYDRGQDFYTNFIAGKNQHLLYRFTPTTFVLFDEVNFSEDTRREWHIA